MLFAANACDEPEDRVHGRIESETPLLAPISGEPVCAAQLRGETWRREGTGRRTSSPLRSPWRFAPGARFSVAGRAYVITDAGGGPTGVVTGDRWDGRTAHPAFGEYGSEGRELLRCHGEDPSGASCTYRYRVHEVYVACGAETSLQGEIQGDAFALHHATSPTGNAIGAGVLGSFALCVMCPVLAVIAAVFAGIIWVSRRKKRAGAP